MTSSIESQTWAMITEVDQSIRTQNRSKKDGEARVAQENCSVQTVSNLQQFEKDVVLPADPHARQLATKLNSASNAGKPQLPTPHANWNAFQDGDADQPGLISIIGSVLALQAKTQSNFWSTLWKQASQSMMMEVQFAPIIGNAINSAYQAQSLATRCQADQAEQEGAISLLGFAGTVIGGGIMDAKDEDNVLNGGDKNGFDDESQPKTNGNVPNGANGQDTEMQDMDSQSQQTIQKENTSIKQQAKNLWAKKSLVQRGIKRFTTVLDKSVKMAMMSQMLSDGLTKFFVIKKYQNQQAAYQAQEGACQALSKEAEQYSQFYGQDFSREEDIRQGAGQNIDYSMNILKSAADTITQTVTSMFRG